MNNISRRTVLKGVGATIALPWLEAMSFSAPSVSRAPKIVAPKRVAFMYIPNGVIGRHWFPTSAGKDFELPQSLRPLKDLQSDINVVSGLNRTYLSGEPHSQCASCWLTSALPGERADGVTAINTTVDQLIARSEVAQATTFPSLELSCNSFTDNVEPKIFDAISWYGPGHDAKSENDPKRVFDRLFGKSKSVKQSVLDTILGEASSLQTKLGAADRRKLDEYLQSVRTIERTLEKQAQSKTRLGQIDRSVVDREPENRGDYIRMMGDLMVLAFQTDQTRVVSFMIGPERWATPQLYDNIFERPVEHHMMTHDKTYDEDVAKIDRFHAEQFAYIVNRLKSEAEGEGNLLDNSCLILGSGLGDGNAHSYEDLPVITAGSWGGEIETGRHIQCSKGTPLANLWLTVAQKMGVDIPSIADSDGPLTQFA